MWGAFPRTVEGAHLPIQGSAKVGIQYLQHPIVWQHASISRRSGETMESLSTGGNNVLLYPIRNRHITKMACPGWYSWKSLNDMFEYLRFVPPVCDISSPCCFVVRITSMLYVKHFPLPAWQALPDLKSYQSYPLCTRALSKICRELRSVQLATAQAHSTSYCKMQ